MQISPVRWEPLHHLELVIKSSLIIREEFFVY